MIKYKYKEHKAPADYETDYIYLVYRKFLWLWWIPTSDYFFREDAVINFVNRLNSKDNGAESTTRDDE